MTTSVILPRDSNQAHGLGQFAIDFLAGSLGSGPSAAVRERTTLFHTDSVLCGLSALALGTNAPTILRTEAGEYPDNGGAFTFGGKHPVKTEKAIVANCAAVREWDSNGTNFGYRPEKGHTAGEFGHNDFYPVAVAAGQAGNRDGATVLRAMILLDEIRGRLAEVFSLKTYKIDHVMHGAIASAATYGAMMGATAEQIEHAIGMVVAHYTPWRAIRAGKQLSDSKGASAAISTEVAILSMKRAMAGFVGPKDIFRNPESLFRQFEPTNGDSPFDLELSHSGDDFAVMGMHFKLGLYEHQSAGALQAVIDLLKAHPKLAHTRTITGVEVTAYEPAFGIIGDPAKRDPRTRQSADHSMVYIVSTLLRKAQELGADAITNLESTDGLWQTLMLMPEDYGHAAIHHPGTRAIMETVSFAHGGPDYDAKYPDGIPTSVTIKTSSATYSSGMVMYPAGHSRNQTADIKAILGQKFDLLGQLAFESARSDYVRRLQSLEQVPAEEMPEFYQFPIATRAYDG